MKKRIITLLLCLATIFCLVACGQDKTPEEHPQENAQQNTTTPTYDNGLPPVIGPSNETTPTVDPSAPSDTPEELPTKPQYINDAKLPFYSVKHEKQGVYYADVTYYYLQHITNETEEFYTTKDGSVWAKDPLVWLDKNEEQWKLSPIGLYKERDKYWELKSGLFIEPLNVDVVLFDYYDNNLYILHRKDNQYYRMEIASNGRCVSDESFVLLCDDKEYTNFADVQVIAGVTCFILPSGEYITSRTWWSYHDLNVISNDFMKAPANTTTLTFSEGTAYVQYPLYEYKNDNTHLYYTAEVLDNEEYAVNLPEGYTTEDIQWIEWRHAYTQHFGDGMIRVSIIFNDGTYWKCHSLPSVAGAFLEKDTHTSEWIQSHTTKTWVSNDIFYCLADDGAVYYLS